MPGIPRLTKSDTTLQMLRDPYRFISNRARLLKSDVFEVRLFLGKTYCMAGKEAAQLFIDDSLFTRKGMAPEPIAVSLFGRGGVQGLDGEAHLRRKTLLMSLMTNENIMILKSVMLSWLDVYSNQWIHRTEVSLYEEFQEILTRTACAWIGVPLQENELKARTNDLTSLFDSIGVGKRRRLARLARKRSENWIIEIVKKIRRNQLPEAEGSPAHIIAHFRHLNGELLDPSTAAVEILNLMRPIIAISVYFVFCIHALHLHPVSRQRLKAQEAGYLDYFINEVRRFYPFFPAITARVRQDFKWGRMSFHKGSRVMLDLYGINHDPREWERPNEFRPDRFKKWSGSPFNFVPHGVGDHLMNHRCPGELITIELMRAIVEYFVLNISYDVPEQSLQIQMNRLPAVPKSHMMISNVRRSSPFLSAAFT